MLNRRTDQTHVTKRSLFYFLPTLLLKCREWLLSRYSIFTNSKDALLKSVLASIKENKEPAYDKSKSDLELTRGKNGEILHGYLSSKDKITVYFFRNIPNKAL